MKRHEWKSRLGVPSEMTAYASIIVGVPNEEPEAPPRREPLVLAWKTGLAT